MTNWCVASLTSIHHKEDNAIGNFLMEHMHDNFKGF